MLEANHVLAGKYRLLRLLGEGGMGSVWEARHELLGTRVAVKVVHPELLRRPGLAERFLQEARVSAQIRSPHVVQVMDVDREADGTAFFVMELLVGEPLSALLDGHRRLPPVTACEYAMQILEGLEVAHALGVVHRDLKPENVIVTHVTGRAVLKIIDFGIAKVRRTDAGARRGLTAAGVSMGTAEYMAPEQAFSADQADPRADLYAVGVMLYEMLAGERPVTGADARIIAAKVMQGEAKPLVHVAPGVPKELAGLVHRAMAPRPAMRFASASEMRTALERILAGLRTGASAPPRTSASGTTEYAVPAGAGAAATGAVAVAAAGGANGAARGAAHGAFESAALQGPSTERPPALGASGVGGAPATRGSPGLAPANGSMMGSAHGAAMGSAHGPAMGSARGAVMGSAHGSAMGSAHGSGHGSAEGPWAPPPATRTSSRRKRRNGWLVPLLLVLLAGSIALIVLALRDQGSGSATSPSLVEPPEPLGATPTTAPTTTSTPSSPGANAPREPSGGVAPIAPLGGLPAAPRTPPQGPASRPPSTPSPGGGTASTGASPAGTSTPGASPAGTSTPGTSPPGTSTPGTSPAGAPGSAAPSSTAPSSPFPFPTAFPSGLPIPLPSPSTFPSALPSGLPTIPFPSALPFPFPAPAGSGRVGSGGAGSPP